MKNRTNEEKLQMLNDACDLLNEAREKIKKANNLLHLCGIDSNNSIDADEVRDWNDYESNIQIFKGIDVLEKLLGVNGKYPTSVLNDKPDRSRKRIAHKGIVFLQLASSSESKYRFK